MKAIVFDNAGTILKRVTALKDISSNNIIFETNTIGMVNKNIDTLLIVFQTPTKELIQHDFKIVDYLKVHPDSYEISYSAGNYTKNDVIKALEHDSTDMEDIKESASALTSKYDIEICSGSAMIVNIKEKRIEYVYTAGGLFFEHTREVFKKLNEKKLSLYIASGDNKESLSKIASTLNVPHDNVYDTCNSHCKYQVIKNLQKKYNHVIMVGNNTNDALAIQQADTGILSTQQGETLPSDLIDSADYVINNIKKVLKIVEKEV